MSTTKPYNKATPNSTDPSSQSQAASNSTGPSSQPKAAPSSQPKAAPNSVKPSSQPIRQWSPAQLSVYLTAEGVPAKAIAYIFQQDVDGIVVISTAIPTFEEQLLNVLTFGARYHVVKAFKKLKRRDKRLAQQVARNSRVNKNRAYKKWSSEEQSTLIRNYYRANMTIGDIAQVHRRSEKAIRSRLYKLRQPQRINVNDDGDDNDNDVIVDLTIEKNVSDHDDDDIIIGVTYDPNVGNDGAVELVIDNFGDEDDDIELIDADFYVSTQTGTKN